MLFKNSFVFAISTAARTPVCTSGVYPVIGECNGYYRCADGYQFPNEYCPDGFLFNEFEKLCDFPHNVNCNNGSMENEISNDFGSGLPTVGL